MIKKILLISFLFIFTFFFGIKAVYAETASISVFPTTIFPGEPFLIQINGITKISAVKKISFDGKKTGFFVYHNKISALVGVDLYKKPGNYELTAEFANGNIIKNTVTVGKREIVEKPMDIPAKLGGNTKASQDKLVASLVADNKSLANIRTNAKMLWSNKFILPLKQIFVTDPYGYSRKTGPYSIAHKGVDYRAREGTEVMAVNRGVVRITKAFRNHGKTIVIDHGLGLMTFYLHLSKFNVKVGDVVEQGQVIGLSGQTGYTEGAHLHLSVRINDVAIDPVKFFELFQ